MSLRASWLLTALTAAGTACGGAAVEQPLGAQQRAPQEPASHLAAEPSRGHAGPPCPVQAATTQLCFLTKEEACAAMGCSAARCSYLYGGSGVMVACND